MSKQETSQKQEQETKIDESKKGQTQTQVEEKVEYHSDVASGRKDADV